MSLKSQRNILINGAWYEKSEIVVRRCSCSSGFFSTSSAFAEKATREECIAKVQTAVKLVLEKGQEEAFKQINDKNGQFVWKDGYVFAVTADESVALAHPIKPNLIGKNMMHVKDINGVMIFAEISRVASSPEGKGWVDYMWPIPGENAPSPKHNYIEKVPGLNVAIGAGYFE